VPHQQPKPSAMMPIGAPTATQEPFSQTTRVMVAGVIRKTLREAYRLFNCPRSALPVNRKHGSVNTVNASGCTLRKYLEV
jgi:hypothetical protein